MSEPMQSPPGFDKSAVNQKKMLAGIMGILFGAFGVHKFILGYTQAAVIMLGVTLGGIILGCCGGLFTGGLLFVLYLAPFAFQVIGIIEGIMYLTKTDEEFYSTYILGRKEWF